KAGARVRPAKQADISRHRNTSARPRGDRVNSGEGPLMIKSFIASRQRHQGGPALMRFALVAATVTVATSWASAMAAPAHHPAAHKAAPANDVAAWLAKCQASESECAIGISEARASFHVTQALSHDPDYCV